MASVADDDAAGFAEVTVVEVPLADREVGAAFAEADVGAVLADNDVKAGVGGARLASEDPTNAGEAPTVVVADLEEARPVAGTAGAVALAIGTVALEAEAAAWIIGAEVTVLVAVDAVMVAVVEDLAAGAAVAGVRGEANVDADFAVATAVDEAKAGADAFPLSFEAFGSADKLARVGGAVGATVAAEPDCRDALVAVGNVRLVVSGEAGAT